MLSLKKIASEAKNRNYFKDKLIIVEKKNGAWGYRIHAEDGRLIKSQHDMLYDKNKALEEAKNFLVKKLGKQ